MTPAEWTYLRPRCGREGCQRGGWGIGGCRGTYQDLVEEVLDELLLQRPRGEQPVQVRAEQFGDEIAVSMGEPLVGARRHLPTYRSSRGEMKTS